VRRRRQDGEPSTQEDGESNVRVLTVDDQAVFRDLARLVIRATRGFESVGEAASGEEALELIDELRPQVVLVDVRMPGIGGIETARRISTSHSDIVVVLISIEDPGDLPSVASESGAMELVRKQDFGPTMLRDLWARYGKE
jgi:DNA-binding NarL/FixJ family response regulator